LQLTDQGEHLREDIIFDAGAEELGGCGAHLALAQSLVHLHHLAADIDFADIAALVSAVALVQPVDGLTLQQPGLNAPAHEARAGVARPQGPVAVEDGGLGRQLVHGDVEFGGAKNMGLNGGTHWEAALLHGLARIT
jgi:hypothetical protein